MSILIVGSIALDSVITPVENHDDLLGGSASYAAVAASFFSPVNLVGIVGKDFPEAHLDYFRSRKIDLAGIEQADGETMRWTGEYEWDLNVRQTRSIALNVFETYSPTIPEAYKKPDVVLLANIAPALQSRVLDQIEPPRFIIADTMDLWINIAHSDLLDLLKRVDLLILNDSEARLLTKETSLIRAGKKIQALGPKYVAIKKGEHGCLLFGQDEFFSCGAYPLEDIHDPTGAGDTFAGGFAGYLTSLTAEKITFQEMKRAVVYGSAIASFNVEAFSLERLRTLEFAEIEERYRMFRAMSQFEQI
ncbi:MAG TPA: PfkB family carbohydrate kinase [Chthoniobacterales bacterium]|jgi:sugar/nucleoside kinase (ribokinase family)